MKTIEVLPAFIRAQMNDFLLPTLVERLRRLQHQLMKFSSLRGITLTTI
jgi:hypothetical protein